MPKVKRVGPLKTKTVYLTNEGLNTLKAQLNTLIKVKKPEALDNIQKAREFGELPENSELQIALDEEALIEDRISGLEETIRNSKIISHTMDSSNIVELGSAVKIKMDGTEELYTLVGKEEANPAKKLISTESPLGKSLIGSKVGDSVQITTPNFSYTVKIIEIH